jgi:hypothetical protein
LERNLVYTGVTRGKQLVVILAQPKALAMAVRTQKSARRLTSLPTRLTAISEPPPLVQPPDRGPEGIQMPEGGMSINDSLTDNTIIPPLLSSDRAPDVIRIPRSK